MNDFNTSSRITRRLNRADLREQIPALHAKGLTDKQIHKALDCYSYSLRHISKTRGKLGLSPNRNSSLLRPVRTRDELIALYMPLYERGLTDAAAAAELGGYDRSRILQIRLSLGLRATRGGLSPKAVERKTRFTREMDLAILRLHKVEGKQWVRIGDVLGVCPQDIAYRYEMLEMAYHYAAEMLAEKSTVAKFFD